MDRARNVFVLFGTCLAVFALFFLLIAFLFFAPWPVYAAAAVFLVLGVVFVIYGLTAKHIEIETVVNGRYEHLSSEEKDEKVEQDTGYDPNSLSTKQK